MSRRGGRGGWVGLLLPIVAAAAFLALQGSALGALSDISADIQGVTSVATAPGGVFPTARLLASVSSPDTWRGTNWRIGSASVCADTPDRSPSGTPQTVSFPITAPGTPGTYDAGFSARGQNNCTGTASNEVVLPGAVRVTTPAPNPALAPRCGIDVMLVLDRSGSIATSGATEKVRDATRAFLTGLSGTGSRVAITDFSTTATQQIPYTTPTPT